MKRDLFDELKEGFNALQSVREGKITLRQHVLEKKPVPSIHCEASRTIIYNGGPAVPRQPRTSAGHERK